MNKIRIASAEIRGPGLIRRGYLLITPDSGKSTKFQFLGSQEFDQIRALMTSLVPEKLATLGPIDEPGYEATLPIS